MDKVTGIIIPGSGEVTDIKVISDKEIRIAVPQDAEVGFVVLHTPQGDITTKPKLTYSEPISMESLSPLSIKPGEVLTIKGEYLNLMHEVIFTDGVVVPESEFVVHERNEIQVIVPVEAQAGKVVISDAGEELPNWIYSEEELSVVLPSVAATVDLTGKKPGDTVEIEGKDFDLVVALEMPNGEEVEFEVIETETGEMIRFELPASMSDGTVVVIPASGVKVAIANMGMALPTEVVATPATGLRGGDVITLEGLNMELITSISFPGVTDAVEPLSQSNTEVTVAMPDMATSGNLLLNTGSGVSVEVAIETLKPSSTSYQNDAVSLGEDVVIVGENLLPPPEPQQQNYSADQLAEMAELLEVRLREYGVKAEVVDTWPGPVITRFEIRPAAGVKVSKISNLAKDLARSLMVKSVRVVEVIPGRPTVGIEIPNPHRAMIRLREVIDSDRYQQADSALTLALGQDIGGGPVVANLGKMPHLLVAGTTGSGKSVGVNAMLISMLLKATPDELRLIMVDPKMLELSVYDGIPHLLAPVVTDMKEAANALRWCVAEMERRYKLMAAMGVRNIAGFNAKLDEAEQAGAQVADPLWEPQPWEMHQTPPVLEKLPYIVVVIDEFADMFMIVGKKVEELIARLAQKARAAGIHLILATQRPSVDVVTGLIKANIPTRMAFQVSSRVDSRTILDQGGAENLLGHGDMLYLPAGSGMPTRVHGAFVDDDEVHRVVEDWKRRGEPEYIEEILSGGVSAEALAGLEAEGAGDGDDAEQDALYDEAVQFVTDSRRASISAVQRRFKIGYNRAARLVEAMEMAGVVSTMGTNGSREVLAPPPVGD